MSAAHASSIAVPFRTVRAQTLAGALALAAAVALPQAVHLAGGPALAQALLPMYLPVMIVGLLAGPRVGAVVGTASPLVSFALTGMPMAALLPAITVQAAACGVVAGLVGRTAWHPIAKALAIVAAGYAASLAFVLVAGLLTNAAWAGSPAAWWAALVVGVPGIVAQLVLLPFVAAWARHQA